MGPSPGLGGGGAGGGAGAPGGAGGQRGRRLGPGRQLGRGFAGRGGGGRRAGCARPLLLAWGCTYGLSGRGSRPRAAFVGGAWAKVGSGRGAWANIAGPRGAGASSLGPPLSVALTRWGCRGETGGGWGGPCGSFVCPASRRPGRGGPQLGTCRAPIEGVGEKLGWERARMRSLGFFVFVFFDSGRECLGRWEKTGTEEQ